MKQKRHKLSMKVKDGLGPTCPTCALCFGLGRHHLLGLAGRVQGLVPIGVIPGRALPLRVVHLNRTRVLWRTMTRQESVAPQPCGRPDIAAHPTNLSAEMRAAAAARAICGSGIRAISRHGN
jgi:hypothetical protein